MLSLLKIPVSEYRDQLLRKQVFGTVSETELAKLTVATAILDQVELVETHVPKLVVAVKVILQSYTSRKKPACK